MPYFKGGIGDRKGIGDHNFSQVVSHMTTET